MSNVDAKAIDITAACFAAHEIQLLLCTKTIIVIPHAQLGDTVEFVNRVKAQ